MLYYVNTYIYIFIDRYIYTSEWNVFICKNTDGLEEYHAKWNGSDKEECSTLPFICGI